MVDHENCLLVDDSREISTLFFSEIKNDVIEFVVCCSRDWRSNGETVLQLKILHVILLCYYLTFRLL